MSQCVGGWAWRVVFSAAVGCSLVILVVALAGGGEGNRNSRSVADRRAALRSLAGVEDDMEFMLGYRALVKEEFRVADWVSIGGQVPLRSQLRLVLATKDHAPQLFQPGEKPIEFPAGGFCQLLTKDGPVDLGSERVSKELAGFVIVGAKDHIFVICPESSDVYIVAREYAGTSSQNGGK